MPLTASRQPLDLVGVLARRGEDDLQALAALIRGEQIDPDRVDTLRRAGLLRAGDHPRVPAKIVAPVLALESALGLRGDGPLSQLLALLKGAAGPSEREMLLDAMGEQLAEHLDDLRQGRPVSDPEGLRGVLDDLDAAVRRLRPDQVDPAHVTRIAELCARLIERLADTLTVRRTRKPQPAAPPATLSALAAACPDPLPRITRPVALPRVDALARALLGAEAPPAQTTRRATLDPADASGRRALVAAALAGRDPAQVLYGQAADSVEALRRHALLIGLGSESLAQHHLRSQATILPGPGPLAWSSQLARRHTAAQAA